LCVEKKRKRRELSQRISITMPTRDFENVPCVGIIKLQPHRQAISIKWRYSIGICTWSILVTSKRDVDIKNHKLV